MSKGDETRAAILDVAINIASTKGFAGLTIGTLAESTDMSKSGLFAHFKSKEQLELQTLERAQGALRRRRRAPLALGAAGREAGPGPARELVALGR